VPFTQLILTWKHALRMNIHYCTDTQRMTHHCILADAQLSAHIRMTVSFLECKPFHGIEIPASVNEALNAKWLNSVSMLCFLTTVLEFRSLGLKNLGNQWQCRHSSTLSEMSFGVLCKPEPLLKSISIQCGRRVHELDPFHRLRKVHSITDLSVLGRLHRNAEDRRSVDGKRYTASLCDGEFAKES